MNETGTTTVGESTVRFESGGLMLPMRGRGKELADLLRVELGIPKDARSFEVRFAVDEVVTVKCEYMPRERLPIPDPSTA